MLSNPSYIHFCPIPPSSTPYYSGMVRSPSSPWGEQGQGWESEEELSRALHCSVLV